MSKSSLGDMSKLIKICHINLKNSKDCLKYLVKNRGLSVDDIKKYKIGFFPQNTSVLTKYVSGDFLREKNIISILNESDFSRYHYLILPLYNEYKIPVGIMGRTLLDEHQRTLLNLPKYKNSSFKKSKILYGLEHSRGAILKRQNVFVVEGNFDVISMHKNGIKNSVGICGSAFSREHFCVLARYTDMITFMLDSDDSGRKSMERVYKRYSNRGIKLRFCKLPSNVKDVDEFFKLGNDKREFYKSIKEYIPTW